jgi:hypothetical protein
MRHKARFKLGEPEMQPSIITSSRRAGDARPPNFYRRQRLRLQPSSLWAPQRFQVYRVQEGDDFGLFKDRRKGGFSNQPRRLGPGGWIILNDPSHHQRIEEQSDGGQVLSLRRPASRMLIQPCPHVIGLYTLEFQHAGRTKCQKCARPPDKRFLYWDCAPALPRAPGRSPQFWLGPILKFPLTDQREPAALPLFLAAIPLAS